jgi:hypothetical protein
VEGYAMIADKENKDFMRQTAKSIRLSKCLEEFVRYQKFSNHSKHTIKYYTLVVLRFVESCQKCPF